VKAANVRGSTWHSSSTMSPSPESAFTSVDRTAACPTNSRARELDGFQTMSSPTWK
jgi:hypothetical protein